MKQIRRFCVFFIEFLLIAVLSTQAKLADETTWWLIVSPSIDDGSRANLDTLVSVLKNVGNLPAGHVNRIEGNQCSRDAILTAIKQSGSQMKTGDTLIFYFRGTVTRPAASNVIVLLPYGATEAEAAGAIEAEELNGWFREFVRGSVTVFLDGYTSDKSIEAFYGNRGLLGNAACISIQRDSAIEEDLFAQNLVAMLKQDAVDLNHNRQITIDELHRYVYEDSSLQPVQGILVPTGNVNTVVMKLSPMLKVVTVPEGATVLLNGETVGETPYRRTNLSGLEQYQVQAQKPGYLVPTTRTVELKPVLGESAYVEWELETAVVSGHITTPPEIQPEEVAVWIDGTPYADNRQPITPDEGYVLPVNMATFVIGRGRSDTQLITPGQHTLRAEAREQYVAEATFTLPPYASVQQDLTLEKKTWFEVAQMRFDRGEHGPAIVAFQNGIEVAPDFPPLSPAFTKMLFDSISEVVQRTNLSNVNYIVATAQLADRLELKDEARRYWAVVKARTAKGSASYKMADTRLKALNFTQRLINIGVLVVLLVVLGSGGFSFYRQRRAKR